MKSDRDAGVKEQLLSTSRLICEINSLSAYITLETNSKCAVTRSDLFQNAICDFQAHLFVFGK